MNLFSPQHLIPILLIVLLLFGRGKISEFMGDFARGIKSFKKGLQEDDLDEKEMPLPHDKGRDQNSHIQHADKAKARHKSEKITSRRFSK